MSSPVLVLATGNPGKRRELADLLADLPVELRDLRDFPDLGPIEESGDGYLANARIKAAAVARATGLPALADDSGLEVDALGGAPGVRSARFATAAAAAPDEPLDRRNTIALLSALADVPEQRRSARFRCVIAVVQPDGAELIAEGTCEGRITTAARGAGGFGYDPVFYHPASGATFAEIPAAEKQRTSHRAAACRALAPHLVAFLLAPSRARSR